MLGELPLGFPHSGAVVIEDYRPARRGPLVYRQHIISCHHAFSFRYRSQSSQPSSVLLYNTRNLLSWLSPSMRSRALSLFRPCTFTSFIYCERNGAQHPSQGALLQADCDPRLTSERRREEYCFIRELSWTLNGGKYVGDHRRHFPPGSPYLRRACASPEPLRICKRKVKVTALADSCRRRSPIRRT
jgi:hypothetical protein